MQPNNNPSLAAPMFYNSPFELVPTSNTDNIYCPVDIPPLALNPNGTNNPNWVPWIAGSGTSLTSQ